MDVQDLFQRYEAHLQEFFADWEIPDCLRYVPQGEGEEPAVCLCDGDAKFYTCWLAEHGYITRTERRWLLATITQHTTLDADWVGWWIVRAPDEKDGSA
jgi:hypothetical protein